MRTNAAASMLGVSASTLRSWERRYGFPRPRRTPVGHREFDLAEVDALRQALQECGGVAAAIATARERGEGPASAARLRGALERFDEEAVDRVLEQSIAVRSIERTVDEVLLPAVAELAEDGASSPAYAFAWRHATGWLAAARRTAPPAHRREGILLFDGTGQGDLDSLHVQALDLCLRRRGLRTLALPVELDADRLALALAAVEPHAVVLCGARAELEALGRAVYSARRVRPGTDVLDYRGALASTGASTVPSLPDAPLAACAGLLARLDGSTAGRDGGLARRLAAL